MARHRKRKGQSKTGVSKKSHQNSAVSNVNKDEGTTAIENEAGRISTDKVVESESGEVSFKKQTRRNKQSENKRIAEKVPKKGVSPANRQVAKSVALSVVQESD